MTRAWVAGGTGVAAILVYLATLFTGVPGGDAGELIGAVATGGVPHPPGYPLYVFVTAPFTWLPFMSVAGRANLAAAVAGGAAAAGLAWTVIRLTSRWWAGVAAGAAFAFSPTVWLYATSAEVFALNNLLLAIQLALFVAVDVAPQKTPGERAYRDRLVYAAALVFGLGLSNQHTSVVFNGIFLAAMIWRTRASWQSARRLAALAGCVAAGLLPYLYLPIAASRSAAVSWGDTGTWSGFAGHFLRRDYGTFQLKMNNATSVLPLSAQLGFYARDLMRQLSWLCIALAAFGLVRGIAARQTRFIAVTTAAAWCIYLVFVHSLATLPLDVPLIHGVVARFWQQPNLLVCLWAGWGIAQIPVVPQRALATIAIGLALTQAAVHFRESNHRQNVVVDSYGRWILNGLPPGALVLMRGDLVTNTTRYLQAAEHVRPDVRLVDQEMLTFRWMTAQVRAQMPEVVVPGTHYSLTEPGSYTLRQLVDANIRSRPVMVCGSVKTGDTSLDGVYRGVPIGLCDRLSPVAEPIDAVAWLAASDAAQPAFHKDVRTIPPADSWEFVAWTDAWTARYRQASTLLTMAIERQSDPALLRAAAERLDRLTRENPQPLPSYYKDLGIALGRLASSDPSAARAAIEALQTYMRLGPASDPDRPAIQQVIRELSAVR